MADHLITDQLLSDGRCEACGSSFSGGNGVTVGPLKCWREDCPGRESPPPRVLTLVPDAD